MRRSIISSAGFNAPRPSPPVEFVQQKTAVGAPASSSNTPHATKDLRSTATVPRQQILTEPRQRLSGHFSANAARRCSRVESHEEPSAPPPPQGDAAVASSKRCRSTSSLPLNDEAEPVLPMRRSSRWASAPAEEYGPLASPAVAHRVAAAPAGPAAVATPVVTAAPPRVVYYPPPAELAVASPPLSATGAVPPSTDANLNLMGWLPSGSAESKRTKSLATPSVATAVPSSTGRQLILSTQETPGSHFSAAVDTTTSVPSESSVSFFMAAMAQQQSHCSFSSADATPMLDLSFLDDSTRHADSSAAAVPTDDGGDVGTGDKAVGVVAEDARESSGHLPLLRLSNSSGDDEDEDDPAALQREIEEDLRMSTDIAFTPSGSGNGVPPSFSQASLLEEELAEAERGGDQGQGPPPFLSVPGHLYHSSLPLDDYDGKAVPLRTSAASSPAFAGPTTSWSPRLHPALPASTTSATAVPHRTIFTFSATAASSGLNMPDPLARASLENSRGDAGQRPSSTALESEVSPPRRGGEADDGGPRAIPDDRDAASPPMGSCGIAAGSLPLVIPVAAAAAATPSRGRPTRTFFTLRSTSTPPSSSAAEAPAPPVAAPHLPLMQQQTGGTASASNDPGFPSDTSLSLNDPGSAMTPLHHQHCQEAMPPCTPPPPVVLLGAEHPATASVSPPANPPAPSFYDLPVAVGEYFKQRRHITALYGWQHELLQNEEVRKGRNFIYSLPTSGGKTLVAELSLLRCLLGRRKSCFFVLPFVSLAEEKTVALQPLGAAFDFRVDGHYGSSGRYPLCPAPAVYICTIEKANSLVNYILEEGRTGEIGAVVVDELHMVGESRRGATLELLLSKLLLISQARHQKPGLEGPTGAADPLQIIGMSATVPNLETIARWLNAVWFERDFRPVPLVEYSVVGGMVLRDGQANERNLPGHSDAEHFMHLATEDPTASVLVFCSSRQQCVDAARGIVRYLQRNATAGQRPSGEDGGVATAAKALSGGPPSAAPTTLPSQASSPAIQALLSDLACIVHHEASLLAEVAQYGVAFHHGGLLAEERELVETAFRRRHLRLLCCTSTLAAGVNLPARRVIIKAPYVGCDFLTKSRYLQMRGRAGRAGLDPYGESFLLLSRRDQSRGHALMSSEVEPTLSRMLEEEETFSKSLLECVGVGLVSSMAQQRAWSSALLASIAVGPIHPKWKQLLPWESVASVEKGEADRCSSSSSSGGGGGAIPPSAMALLVEAAAALLADRGLIAVEEDTEKLEESLVFCNSADGEDKELDCPKSKRLRVTPFGSSSVRSCFSVEEALLLREELDHLRHTGLILSDDLHLCYLLTPLREVGECDWGLLRQLLSRLSESRQRIAALLGVDFYFVDQCAMGLGVGHGAAPTSEEGRRSRFTARRFFVALLLADVLAEVPMMEVEQRYQVNRGQIQSLMRSASMFSSSITSFCRAMEWYSLEAVLSSFVKRLGFGVKPDLLPLMEIRAIQPARARALWNAGFKTLAAIAACDAETLLSKVKSLNPPENKAAKFFTARSALVVIREATVALQSKIDEKKGELLELTTTYTAAL